MSNKVNKNNLVKMFSKSPQTTLGIKKIILLDTKNGIAKATYSAKKNMCHSGNIVQGGFITGWLDAIMALACMSKLGSDGKPIYNEKGKVMKGPNYFKPDLGKYVA